MPYFQNIEKWRLSKKSRVLTKWKPIKNQDGPPN